VQNSGYFSSKLDQTIFLRKEDDKNTNCLITLANMPTSPLSRSKTSLLSTPSIKARLNNEKTRSVPVQRTKRGKQRAASVEIVSDDEEPEIPISTKKLPPPPVLGEYLLTARTCVGIQPVYRESQSTMSGLWSARHYFDESTKKAGAMTNERGIEPVLQSSTATIYSKAMKPAEYITNDVNEPRDWSYVESVVNHLAKSLSKGICVDLVIKYGVKCVAEEVEDVDEVEAMEFIEEDVREGIHSRNNLIFDESIEKLCIIGPVNNLPGFISIDSKHWKDTPLLCVL